MLLEKYPDLDSVENNASMVINDKPYLRTKKCYPSQKIHVYILSAFSELSLSDIIRREAFYFQNSTQITLSLRIYLNSQSKHETL